MSSVRLCTYKSWFRRKPSRLCIYKFPFEPYKTRIRTGYSYVVRWEIHFKLHEAFWKFIYIYIYSSRWYFSLDFRIFTSKIIPLHQVNGRKNLPLESRANPAVFNPCVCVCVCFRRCIKKRTKPTRVFPTELCSLRWRGDISSTRTSPNKSWTPAVENNRKKPTNVVYRFRVHVQNGKIMFKRTEMFSRSRAHRLFF